MSGGACRVAETNKENNKKLTDSIAAQSDILDKFVDKFVKEMENCFKAMNTVIEERVTSFGTTQFNQSRELLEGRGSGLPGHSAHRPMPGFRQVLCARARQTTPAWILSASATGTPAYPRR